MARAARPNSRSEILFHAFFDTAERDDDEHLHLLSARKGEAFEESIYADKWADAMRREEYFRPLKKQITMRLDADVLDWLKSKGEGHLTRINEILRKTMTAELKR